MDHYADTTESLLALRKVTRSIADLVREQVKTYVATLSPLLRPRLVFGDHVQGTTRESPRHADAALRDLTALYERLAPAKPFGLRTPLQTPARLASTTIELAPFDYTHVIGARRITVRAPLKWVLCFQGAQPAKLRDLLATAHRSAEELHDTLVAYLIMHIVAGQQKSVCDILAALRFPVTTEHLPEFGDVPLTCISCAVSTRRPSDDIVVQSADISGMDAFEEVVKADDIDALQDGLKEQLAAILREQGLAR